MFERETVSAQLNLAFSVFYPSVNLLEVSLN